MPRHSIPQAAAKSQSLGGKFIVLRCPPPRDKFREQRLPIRGPYEWFSLCCKAFFGIWGAFYVSWSDNHCIPRNTKPGRHAIAQNHPCKKRETQPARFKGDVKEVQPKQHSSSCRTGFWIHSRMRTVVVPLFAMSRAILRRQFCLALAISVLNHELCGDQSNCRSKMLVGATVPSLERCVHA